MRGLGRFLVAPVMLAGALVVAQPASAGSIYGFNGAFDPTAGAGINNGNGWGLLNFFGWNTPGVNYSINSVNLSADHSTLTFTMYQDPNAVGSFQSQPNHPFISNWDSVGFGANPSLITLPAGSISYNWEVSLDQNTFGAEISFNTDACPHRVCSYGAGNYFGSISSNNPYDLTWGMGFDQQNPSQPLTATITLTDFVYVMEPSSILLLGTAFALLGVFAFWRQRSARVRDAGLVEA